MPKTVKKVRAIAGILYPESASADWQNKIADLHMMALVSPLHDSDVQADGSPKKPHYHVMLIFDGPVAVDRAAKLLQDIGCIDYTQSIHSVTSYARYLCHLDDHDKHQYDTNDIKAYGGADYELMCQRSLIKILQSQRWRITLTRTMFIASDVLRNTAELINLLGTVTSQRTAAGTSRSISNRLTGMI